MGNNISNKATYERHNVATIEDYSFETILNLDSIAKMLFRFFWIGSEY